MPDDSTGDDLFQAMTIAGLGGGQRLFDRYVLRRRLGRGGMGIVWQALDEKLEREIALKFLPDLITLDLEAIADMKRETRRSLELTHSHIVRIYDFIQDERWAAISMEYVKGDSLANLKAGQPEGHFEVEQLRSWVVQLSDALEYAHTRAKVIHRDLKPANLMIDSGGELKVADFGISSTVNDSVSRVSMRGRTSGTLAFMSPQQAQGRPSKVTDDVYSLGATLYDLLSSKPPFHTGNIQHQLDNIVPEKIAQRREQLGRAGQLIPPVWETTIACCLEKESARRPQTVVEVAELLGLRERKHTTLKSAPPKPSGIPVVPSARRSPRARLVVVASALVLLLVAGSVYRWVSRSETPAPTGPVQPGAVASNSTVTSSPTVATDNAEAAGYRVKALAGDGEAARKLGHLYYYGTGVPKSLDEGLKWLQFASDHSDYPAQSSLAKLYQDDSVAAWFQGMAASGNPSAQVGLGYMYENGWAVPQDFAQARSLYEKAANAGNSEAFNNIGNLYEEGKGVPINYAEALAWYRRAANLGNGDAMTSLGTMYVTGRGVDKNDSQAVHWFQKAAAQNCAPAQNLYGEFFETGRGVPQDYYQAVYWLKKAADQGYADAENNLGAMYQKGLGVAQDYGQALAWCRKAADQNNALAQVLVAGFYLNGWGTDEDYGQAFYWSQKAANQGNAMAQNALGDMYFRGIGVSKNSNEAVVWFRKAADQGNLDAISNLGFMYANGDGVAKNIPTAVEFFRKAAAGGEPRAKSALSNLRY
jgi:TPR repeat protein